MNDIKPIETEYNGYRFRSRLEARWAVFFDEAQIAYEYEVEGYELSDGVKYLPDFYLPEFQLYVEIKPMICHEPGWKERMKNWEDKCGQYRTDTGKAILIVYGDPAKDIWGRLFAWTSDDLVMPNEGKIEEYTGDARFIPVGERINPDIILMTNDTQTDTICINPKGEANKKITNPEMMIFWYRDDAIYLLVQPMYYNFDENEAKQDGTFDNIRKRARQARFEYGESGYQSQKHEKKTTLSPTDELLKKLGEIPSGDPKIAEILKKSNEVEKLTKYGGVLYGAPSWAKELYYLQALHSLGYEYTGVLDWELIDTQRKAFNEVHKAIGWTEIDPITGLLIEPKTSEEMYRPSKDVCRFIDTLEDETRRVIVKKFMSPGVPTWEDEIQLLDLYREMGFEPSGTLQAEQEIRATIEKNSGIA